jgi:hypothetical protein
MLIPPGPIVRVMEPCAPMGATRLFAPVKRLVVGAALAAVQRALTSVMRVMGGPQDASFQLEHRVLKRAPASMLRGGHMVLWWPQSQLTRSAPP